MATTNLNNIDLWKFSLRNPEPPFGEMSKEEQDEFITKKPRDCLVILPRTNSQIFSHIR
jgi:hypothetical protein